MKKKKAVAGEGCLVEKRPGYYEYRISYRDMFGNRKIKSFGGKDIDELYIRADEFRHDLSEMQRGVQVDATIPEILRRRYEYDFAKNYTQEPGYYRNMDSLKIIERSPIGKIPIRDLEKEDIERFLISIVKYSNSVIGKTFGQLKLAYREAISSEIITKKLMDNKDSRRPKSKKRARKVSAFTREEQQIFLDVMRKHRVPKNRNDYRKQQPIKHPMSFRQWNVIVTGWKTNQFILRLPFAFLTSDKTIPNEKVIANNLMQQSHNIMLI